MVGGVLFYAFGVRLSRNCLLIRIPGAWLAEVEGFDEMLEVSGVVGEAQVISAGERGEVGERGAFSLFVVLLVAVFAFGVHLSVIIF